MLKNNYKKYITILLIGVLLVCVLVYQIYKNQSTNELELVFFDVGQGDSIFINTPNNQQILIDGGPDTSVVSKIGEQLEFYDHHLDLVILTHPHDDHIIGLIEVLKRYEVEYVMYDNFDIQNINYQEWENIIKDKQIKVLNPVQYNNLRFGDVEFEVIYPFENLTEKIDDLNETSIVLRMEYQNFSALLTGDATSEVEKKIIKRQVSITSDLLKVGHHGSKYSSSFEFLEKVVPKYAIIQSGKNNKFGHPHTITLNKLIGSKIEVLRSDMLGDIKFIYNNGELIIK